MNDDNLIRSKLRSLSAKYRRERQRVSDCWEIFERFANRKAQRLVDSIVTAANLAVSISHDPVDPLAVEALRVTNPHIDIFRLSDRPSDVLEGIVNSAKGKYFELLVAERLNDGGVVGDIILSDGQKAVLAESLTNPSWDLQILDDGGHVVEYLQLKATNSLSYIKQALESTPDIRIVATDEVVEAGHDFGGMILDSNFSNSAIRDNILHTIDIESPTSIERLQEAFRGSVPIL